LRLGTRGSPLALAQAGWVARQLGERCGQAVVLVTVATPGDESAAPVERLGTTGVFTTTLREALPPGARIGTGSPRRAALLRAAGRHLEIVPVRGNVGTRLRKLADGQVDALVLAMAGLARLGLLDAAVTPFDPAQLMPAPAQGILAVECRVGDAATAAQLSTLDHAPTRAAAIAERGFLAALDAGCTAPVGALAGLSAEPGAGAAVRLSGLIAAPDGSSVVRAQLSGAAAGGAALGRRLARVLLADGGAALLGRTPCWTGQRPPGRDPALPFTYYR
jgi:hydroxymethylbilane synthase